MGPLAPLLLLLGLASAHAASPIALLDDDASLAARLEPAHLKPLVTTARQISSRGDAVATAAGALATARFGFDPLSTAGWARAGFDPVAPVYLSVAAPVLAADRAGRAGAPAWWRARAVLPIADPVAAHETIREIFGFLPGDRLFPGDAGAPRMPGLVAAVVASRVYLLARERDGAILVDLVVSPKEGVRAQNAWRVAARRGNAQAVRFGRALSEEGLSIWIASEALYALDPRAARGADPGCQAYRWLAEHGALEALTIRLWLHRDAVRARLRWTIRPGSDLEDYLRAGSHLGRIPGRAALALAWAIDQPSKLAALPRPTALDGPSRDVGLYADACGPSAALTLRVFGWPELVGAFFGQLARVGPRAAALAKAAGPGAFAVRRLVTTPGPAPPSRTPGTPLTIDALEAAVEIAARDDAPALVEPLLDTIFGAREAADGGAVDQIWGGGRLRPYRRARGDVDPVYGVGRGARSIDWYSRAAARGATPPQSALVWLRADAGQLVAAFRHRSPTLAGWLDRGLLQIGTLEVRAGAEQNEVIVDAKLGLREL